MSPSSTSNHRVVAAPVARRRGRRRRRSPSPGRSTARFARAPRRPRGRRAARRSRRGARCRPPRCRGASRRAPGGRRSCRSSRDRSPASRRARPSTPSPAGRRRAPDGERRRRSSPRDRPPRARRTASRRRRRCRRCRPSGRWRRSGRRGPPASGSASRRPPWRTPGDARRPSAARPHRRDGVLAQGGDRAGVVAARLDLAADDARRYGRRIGVDGGVEQGQLAAHHPRGVEAREQIAVADANSAVTSPDGWTAKSSRLRSVAEERRHRTCPSASTARSSRRGNPQSTERLRGGFDGTRAPSGSGCALRTKPPSNRRSIGRVGGGASEEPSEAPSVEPSEAPSEEPSVAPSGAAASDGSPPSGPPSAGRTTSECSASSAPPSAGDWALLPQAVSDRRSDRATDTAGELRRGTDVPSSMARTSRRQ